VSQKIQKLPLNILACEADSSVKIFLQKLIAIRQSDSNRPRNLIKVRFHISNGCRRYNLDTIIYSTTLTVPCLFEIFFYITISMVERPSIQAWLQNF